MLEGSSGALWHYGCVLTGNVLLTTYIVSQSFHCWSYVIQITAYAQIIQYLVQKKMQKLTMQSQWISLSDYGVCVCACLWQTWRVPSRCGSSCCSCCWTRAISTWSAGRLMTASSSCSSLRRWPSFGVWGRTKRIWITINWAELCATTTTR